MHKIADRSTSKRYSIVQCLLTITWVFSFLIVLQHAPAAYSQTEDCTFFEPEASTWLIDGPILTNQSSNPIPMLGQPNTACTTDLADIQPGGQVVVLVDQGDYLYIRHIDDNYKNAWVRRDGFSNPIDPETLPPPEEPTVSGNTISWPDDGWYQVQRVSEEGIIEVCAGVRFCEVPNGTYIVINHDTGERFEPIEVNGDAPESGVMVSGNTISWPNDGWYQVQAVTDTGIVEVCAGTEFCEVPNGTYIVINHDTGERFEPIVVNTDPTGEQTSVLLPAALAAPVLAEIEPGSPLSVANHEKFVRAFYDIAEPRVLNNLLRQISLIQAELQAAMLGADSRFVAESVTSIENGEGSVAEFACPDGGTVGAVFNDDGSDVSRILMNFRLCTLGRDRLSGVTFEVQNSEVRPLDPVVSFTDRTFGGYTLETRLYPFMEEALGLGDEGEQFTVVTEAGLGTSIFGRVIVEFLNSSDPRQLTRRWRGNWSLKSPVSSLFVTDLHSDVIRRPENTSSRDGNVSKPYFVASGTVTNGREITAINHSDFREVVRLGVGMSGIQFFQDARGGLMNLIGESIETDNETREQQTRVRIDTEGVILNRVLPAELELTPFLSGQ